LKQYEIWWADLPQPAGRRPVLLLSREDAYSYLNKFVAVEITATIRNIPVEVGLGKNEGLSRRCVANLDNLRTIGRSALSQRIGVLERSRRVEVKRALGYALGWGELIDLDGTLP
jgi:mRNA interferase MazF